MSARLALILFARDPLPGQVKTRLISVLGPEDAAELYRCFLLDSLEAATTQPADVFVAAADAASVEPVRALARPVCPRAHLLEQVGRDLGERMSNAFTAVFGMGYPSAVLLGTDAPSLPPLRVSDALDRSTYRDLVIGPSLDGGYYLIGMRRTIPECFSDIEWGGPGVLLQTLQRAQQAAARVTLLEPWYDVDTPDDLRVLRSHLSALCLAGEPIFCERTWEFVRALPVEL